MVSPKWGTKFLNYFREFFFTKNISTKYGGWFAAHEPPIKCLQMNSCHTRAMFCMWNSKVSIDIIHENWSIRRMTSSCDLYTEATHLELFVRQESTHSVITNTIASLAYLKSYNHHKSLEMVISCAAFGCQNRRKCGSGLQFHK